MVKIVISILVAFLLVIFIAQNTVVVEINFFTLTFSMSLAILALLMLISGVFLGFVATQIAFIRKCMKKRKKEKVRQDKEEAKSEKDRQKQESKDRVQEEKKQKQEKRKG